jgi:hypothetical protein
MIKPFTLLKRLASFCFFVFSLNLAAQPLVLKIDAPASIAGSYVLIASDFGPKKSTELLNKPLKQGGPDTLACGGTAPFTTDLTGTIGFVDRGTCSFAPKVLLAQQKGAIATIICNTATGMPVSPAFSGVAATDNAINTQSFLMLKPDCDKIKVEMRKGTVTGSLITAPCTPAKDTTVKNIIWGDKSGDGDFAGGVGKWTIETPAGKGWEWGLWGDLSRGAFVRGKVFIGSNTACNGAMIFDSDFLDTKGSEATVGQGTCPAPCTSSFTSPNIDLSASSGVKGISVVFTQAYRQFRSQFLLLASYDNGVKWDTFRINGDAPVNSGVFVNNKVKVGLCNADLSKKQIKLRFAMVGNYYYWAVDDVFIINDDASDVQTDDFYARPYTHKTPLSQVYSFPLLADVRNFGPNEAPGTVLTAAIEKQGGTASAPTYTEVQKETLAYNTIKGCQVVENIPFAKRGNIPASEGVYRITYTTSTTGKNDITSNDSRNAFFRVSQNSYSTSINEIENGGTFFEWFSNITNPAYVGKNDMTVGQYYFFPKGKSVRATRFYFGVNDNKTQTNAFESVLRCEVYKVKPGGTDDELSPAELTKVASGFDPAAPDNEDMFIDSSTVNKRRLYFLLKDVTGKPFQLEDNTGYVFLLKNTYFKGPAYSTTSPVHLFPYLGFNETRFANFNAAAAEFAQNDVIKGERTYGGILNNGDVLVGNAGVKIYNEVILETVTAVEDELAEASFNVYPNPATSELFVDLDLVNTAKQVNIKITDITGRILVDQTMENVKSETITIPVSKIPSGIYLTKIETPEGSATKKVVIAN